MTATDAGPGPAGVTPGPARRAGMVAAAAPVLAAAAVMTAAGLWGLTRYWAMGNDEVVSRWAALLSLRQLAHLLRHIDAVHGLYYLLLHGWMALGTSPTIMRIPSVISMVIGAALLVVMGRRLTGSGWAGLLSGLIMAFTPFISYYAQTARSYALVYACVLGATLALLNAMEAEKAGQVRGRFDRRWATYAGLMTLSAYLNEMALLVLGAHAITVVLARYGRGAVRHWAWASAASVVLVSPLLALSARQASQVDWIPRPGLRDLWILYHDYFGATLVAPVIVLACAVVSLVPASRPWRRESAAAPGNGGKTPAAWPGGGITLQSVAAPLLLVPAILLIAEARIGPSLYQDRYVLYGEAGAALLAGAGAYRLGRWLAAAAGGWRSLIWLPGIAVCACTLLLQLGPQHRVRMPFSREFNFGGPSFYVGAHARHGDGVLFLGPFFRKARLGYPGEFRETSDFALAVPPSVAKPYKGIEKPFAAIRPLMLEHHRIWVIGIRPSQRLSDPLLRKESTVLLQDFRRVLTRGYHGMGLTLWLRR